MEASKALEDGLLNHILPPRLDDAGLEDSALTPDSIKEAFTRAATAAKSRATAIFTSGEDKCDCVEDPSTVEDKPNDVVVGISPESEPPGPCATAKGTEFPEIGQDVLLVGNVEIEEGKTGDVLVGGDERKEGDKACVDGWQSIEKKGKLQINNGGDEEEKEEDKEAKRPILTEGFA